MQIDLRSTKARAAAGLAPDIVLEPYQRGRQIHRPRYETNRAICDAVAASPNPLTRLEICRAIGRAKSPHLLTVIEDLAAVGVLERRTGVHVNGRACYVYSMAGW